MYQFTVYIFNIFISIILIELLILSIGMFFVIILYYILPLLASFIDNYTSRLQELNSKK